MSLTPDEAVTHAHLWAADLLETELGYGRVPVAYERYVRALIGDLTGEETLG